MEVLETTGLTTELTHHSHVQVDESLLTEDCPPPPYMAMTLPGGGTMNLPMDPVRTGADSPDTDSTTTATTALGQDVLSVTAGEPATHFNLDQLLNIVQSFQLDTTHAAQEEKKVMLSVCERCEPEQTGRNGNISVGERTLLLYTSPTIILSGPYQALLRVGLLA